MNDLKINCQPNCGNSPKMAFLRDFNLAFARGDVDFILDNVSEDIHWEVIGEGVIEGKEAFGKSIKEMAAFVPEEITIYQIVSHGKQGGLNGELIFPDGKLIAFCDMYEFVSAGKNLIRKMYSYAMNKGY
ncbi:nuclear transport factor 2 family protein [Reichenbachiella ulvae]|uniref:Nuclear transport factor 2 family protein n=1 Tax=Reichenbachiella ulvae TaxID=2980104 RepID=A0ABT3CPQ6_9BACT|nr:nuclear transport factor 2 family protein [Reichenbachiella ulvae]MCV9385449.1 nuclear transport factor 2 family protein [Reichenbachiella ulvae]